MQASNLTGRGQCLACQLANPSSFYSIARFDQSNVFAWEYIDILSSMQVGTGARAEKIRTYNYKVVLLP